MTLGLGGILLLSTDSLIARGADASAWDVAFWSGSWAAVAVLVVLTLASGPGPAATLRRDGIPLIISGILQMTSGVAFIVAVKETAIANVVVITASAPIAAALIALFALGEQPSRRVWLGIVTTLAGIVIVVSSSLEAGPIRGELAALVAVLAFACNLSLWRHYKELSRTGAVGIAGLLMAVVCAWPAAVVGLSATTMLLLALMGAVVGPIARVSLASSTRHLSASEVGLFTPVETVAASFGAWLLFEETPAAATWAGGALVLAGVVVGLSSARAR